MLSCREWISVCLRGTGLCQPWSCLTLTTSCGVWVMTTWLFLPSIPKARQKGPWLSLVTCRQSQGDPGAETASWLLQKRMNQTLPFKGTSPFLGHRGRKTPELGIVPPPPAPRASKHQTPAGQAEILTTHATGRSHLVSDLIPEPFGVGSVSLDPEIQQAVNYSSHPSQLLSSATSTAEMLQPVKVKTESTGNESDYLLNLLDPLKTASWQSSGPQQGPRSLQSSAAPPAAAGFVSVASDFVPPAAAPFVQPLGYPSPAPPPFFTAIS